MDIKGITSKEIYLGRKLLLTDMKDFQPWDRLESVELFHYILNEDKQK